MSSTFLNGKIEKLDAIGARIRRAREEAGLTQVELGEALGLGGGAVAQVELGHNALQLKHLLALPKILNRPIAWFLDLPSPAELTPDEEDLLAAYRALAPGYPRKYGLEILQGWANFRTKKD